MTVAGGAHGAGLQATRPPCTKRARTPDIKRAKPALCLLWFLVLGFAAAGCRPSGQGETSGAAVQVTVSILPQKYFVERIGGGRVAVNVMVEPGANPETYEPKPSQLRALRGSAAYFGIGVPFESAWMSRLASSNPGLRIVDTSAGVERIPMVGRHHHHGDDAQEEAANHAHTCCSHRPGEPDPHIWLSPRRVAVQAAAICDALCELDPPHAAGYRANLEGFLTELTQLDEEIRRRFRDVPGRSFLIFHPAWGYFARDYDLEMIPVEVGGREPSAAELRALIDRARELGIRAVVVQPEFSTATARTLADQIGGRLVMISPLAPDWADNLRRAADAIAGALAGGQNPS